MGFDLFGEKAKSVEGEYFRNNVWGWRPLAEYVLSVCELQHGEEWSWNNGYKVSAKNALYIADVLNKELSSGGTEKYARAYARRKVKDYPFSVENVREFARFARASGGFTIC